MIELISKLLNSYPAVSRSYSLSEDDLLNAGFERHAIDSWVFISPSLAEFIAGHRVVSVNGEIKVAIVSFWMFLLGNFIVGSFLLVLFSVLGFLFSDYDIGKLVIDVTFPTLAFAFTLFLYMRPIIKLKKRLQALEASFSR